MDISQEFSEQDVRTKHISPAIAHAGWDLSSPLVREEFPITAGRIIAKIDGLLAQIEEKLK